MDTLPATRLPAQGSAPVKPQVSRPYANAAMALHSSRLGGPLPLPPGRKTPPPTGWTGATGKYPSGADVAEWIDGQPDGNVAVRLADGVVGIDVDQYPTAGKHKVGGQSLAAAENHLGPLPPTFWSTSRADGVSGIRLFRVPLGTVLVSQFSTARLGADVEVIQRHHRYAVVAPSVHPDGRTYRWIGPDGVDLHDGEVPSVDDLADLPPAWVEALSVDSSRAALGAEIISPPSEWPTAPRSHPYVAVMVSALATDTPPGTWHDWLHDTCHRLAAASRLGLITADDLTTAQRTVLARLHTAQDSRSTDEDPRQEANRSWRTALERTSRMSQAEARTSGRFPDTVTALGAAPTDQEQPVDSPQDSDERPASWGRIDLAAYLDGTHKPQEPELMRRIDGVALLYASRVHSFHGESESGKSWAALVAARDCLAAGQRVVMLDYESDASTVVSRLLLLGVERTAIAAHFDYRRPEAGPNASAQDAAAWRELLAAPAALAIIDGVTEALATVGRASIDNDEITQWVRELPRRLAQRTGAAVVLVDHVTKDADARGRFAIGGQAKMAALDGAAYVVEVLQPLGVGLRGALALRVGKDRPGMVRPHAGTRRKSDRTQEVAVLTVDSTEPGVTVATLEPPRTTTLDATPAAAEPTGPFRPTILMERASRAAQLAGQPQSRNDLVRTTGGNKAAALAAVDRLVAEGFLATDGPRRGGHPTLRFVGLYTEATDRFQNQNQSASPAPSSGTGTGSRSKDRGPGTSHRNQSDRFQGTSQNQFGTSAEPPSAPAGIDLDALAGQPCCKCEHRIGHAPSCTSPPAA